MTAPIAGTAVLQTPAGPLGIVVEEDGTVVASGFCDLDDLLERLGLDERPPRAPAALVGPIAEAVDRYFAGSVDALDDVPVRQRGGAFTQRAWEQLRTVPPGESISYAELAALAGSPGAARAAGQACARNLVAPFVPCHRVVPSSGGVGSYGYGADVKRRLLAHERAAG